MSDRKVRINVPVLARVEGEGALDLHIENGEITHLELRIFEPPRLFEKFLEGRHFSEVPDIVARICGICPVAYQMSAVAAFESLFQTDVNEWVSDMRRLFYCGEWLESHALHIHLLAAPDFLGYESAPAMSKDFPEEVKRGIRIQHLGNAILKFLGGRSVHPVGVKVGGFHHAPGKRQAGELLTLLKQAEADVEALLPWVAGLPMPAMGQQFTSVALCNGVDYPMMGECIVSDAGHSLHINDYENHFKEVHQAHSTALFSLMDGSPYLVGPLARVNQNWQHLPPETQGALKASGIQFPSNNMYLSIVARAAEIQFAYRESVRLLEKYQSPERPSVDVKPRAGTAFGCSEAPRGILWHRYEVDNDGFIVNAKIVPPTSQNQSRMEEDLRYSITQFGLNARESEIRQHAEQIIRNYDPCISCATHFLDLRLQRI